MNQAILQTMQHRRLLIPKRLPGNSGPDQERSSLFNPCRKRRTAAASAVVDELAEQPSAPAAGDQETASPAVREEKAVLSDSQLQATVQEARHTLRGTGVAK